MQSLIQSPIAVFSKSYCPYCDKSKSLLKQLGQGGATKVMELDQVKDGAVIQAYLAERAGVSRVTVPQVSARVPGDEAQDRELGFGDEERR